MQVRFGGRETPRGYLFELTGGCLCLDLANTVDERGKDRPRDLLPRYEELLNWGVQAGAVLPSEAAAMHALASRQRAAATRALRRAVEAREAIFQIFSAVAGRRPAPNGALGILNRVLPDALGDRSVALRGRQFVWQWRHMKRPDFNHILWAAVVSAAELLMSPDRLRVRECAGAGCDWLFIDRSRNGTRRWCDMTVCGNRAKARRHYARSRGHHGTDA